MLQAIGPISLAYVVVPVTSESPMNSTSHRPSKHTDRADTNSTSILMNHRSFSNYQQDIRTLDHTYHLQSNTPRFLTFPSLFIVLCFVFFLTSALVHCLTIFALPSCTVCRLPELLHVLLLCSLDFPLGLSVSKGH